MTKLFKPTPYEDGTLKWKEIEVILKENWSRLTEYDREAREAGTLVGRYIRESYADGFAVYLIVKENIKTVRIKRLSYICPDEWSIPYWGDAATIKKDYAIQSVNGRDAWERMMNGSGN